LPAAFLDEFVFAALVVGHCRSSCGAALRPTHQYTSR
jgi:hypothetical protein